MRPFGAVVGKDVVHVCSRDVPVPTSLACRGAASMNGVHRQAGRAGAGAVTVVFQAAGS